MSVAGVRGARGFAHIGSMGCCSSLRCVLVRRRRIEGYYRAGSFSTAVKKRGRVNVLHAVHTVLFLFVLMLLRGTIVNRTKYCHYSKNSET